ncbi:hypothetical protein [Comamonas testosteroni]|uniref:hypothetical protein n=1 Tax=Comamonas testosteroni TaxID=285 RepID=UPI0005B3A465|nr:hypothetical protein [Comamonas testosteroni]
MPANRFLPDEWENRLEEIDLEILHQAAICKIRLLEPGAVERVLANDAGICGAVHETAFRTLRGLLYLHYTEVLHISEVLSPEIAQVIADRVREHLRRRSGTQSRV